MNVERLVAAGVLLLLVVPAVAQTPPLPPCPSAPWITVPCDTTAAGLPAPPTTIAHDEIYVSIWNQYNTTLSAMGMAGVQRQGADVAEGTLARDGDVYSGVLTVRAYGSMNMRSVLGNCSDNSRAMQEILAVAHIEEPSTGYTAGQTAIGGDPAAFDLTFYFFPVTAPMFLVMPTCQTVIGFEGYGTGAYDNEAPYPWLPQVQPRGEFIPLNDTRWSTQNGLRLHAPVAGGEVGYRDESDTVPSEQVFSTWTIYMSRGE